MSALSSIFTLRPTDLLTVGKSAANVGAGLFIGVATTICVAILAERLFKYRVDQYEKISLGIGMLAGFTASYLLAPQVVFSLALAKVAQVALLTAIVALGIPCASKNMIIELDEVVIAIALPALGLVGIFVGSYAGCIAGMIGVVGVFIAHNTNPSSQPY